LVTNSLSFVLNSSSLLVDFFPAPSRAEPASVGLKVSGKNGCFPASKFAADWSCRPWSALSMNSLPFHVSE
jgi:hypothetical protein